MAFCDHNHERKEALADLSPHENKMALLRLDLDHFKEVNETFGYAVGDFLLRSVAKRLVALRQGTDLLAFFEIVRGHGGIVIPHHTGYKVGCRGMQWKRFFQQDITPLL